MEECKLKILFLFPVYRKFIVTVTLGRKEGGGDRRSNLGGSVKVLVQKEKFDIKAKRKNFERLKEQLPPQMNRDLEAIIKSKNKNLAKKSTTTPNKQNFEHINKC